MNNNQRKKKKMNSELNELRIKDLKAERYHAIRNKEMFIMEQRLGKTEASKLKIQKAEAEIVRINAWLFECGRISTAIHGAGIQKTKRQFVGALISWSEQMQDANKNPKTTEAERLFNRRAIERISTILQLDKKKETECTAQ
jgi:hypothetical protein